ncbi:hypothetical protein HK413_06145 [Mucilaginibacter sp. S1162]|uniref:MBG domain-containing protein n=1 Tax=Mucilaginibacter humi TaxID=2732510 RepID=A0ABX1W3J9_9SPHI|nr:hypothetical protein [Mucilaginibacter humi]NNU33829.1 hypothetical protein [Mucilaginibacter humi]
MYTSPTPYVGSVAASYDNRFAGHITYSGTTGNALLGTTISITTLSANGALPKKTGIYALLPAPITAESYITSAM